MSYEVTAGHVHPDSGGIVYRRTRYEDELVTRLQAFQTLRAVTEYGSVHSRAEVLRCVGRQRRRRPRHRLNYKWEMG